MSDMTLQTHVFSIPVFLESFESKRPKVSYNTET
jgi:hypothetical protein